MRWSGGIPRRQRGFTLLELLVALSVIGVLLAFVLPRLSGAVSASRKGLCEQNMVTAGLGLEAYRLEHGGYPSDENLSAIAQYVGEKATRCPDGSAYYWSASRKILVCYEHQLTLKLDEDGERWTAEPGALYVGNRNTKKFHLPTCYWASQISPQNRVEFRSRQEAVKAGYSPCGHCKP